MFKKILCAIDFSEFTEEIVGYALAIGMKFDAELHFIHVIPSLTYFTPYESFLTPENLMTVEKNIAIEVDSDFDKVVKDINIPFKKVVKSGVIFAELIDY